MESEILLAIISKIIDERLAAIPLSHGPRGPRGHSGPPGEDGKSFVFAEHEATIRSWAKELALKFEDLSAEQIESLRGPRGRDGANGKDFNFEENRESIQEALGLIFSEREDKLKLKFSDLTADEIAAIRGPAGRDGADGKSVDITDVEKSVRQTISDISDSLKLKFSDLTSDEISALRGPRGLDGRSFIFEENKDAIEGIIRESVAGVREELRLKFSDLTADDIEQLRGPRGRDGRDGRDGDNFVFDEHREFFLSLKPKFSDFTAEEREALRLHFSDLTPEEKSELKLRFQDLTEEDRTQIRGSRGQRGQKGSPGRDGIDGKQGPRGLPGVRGISGIPGTNGRDGADGQDGVDGKDAPYVTDITIDEFPLKNEIAFVFNFSDGSQINSERVRLPKHTNIYVEGAGGGGGGGGTTAEVSDWPDIQGEYGTPIVYDATDEINPGTAHRNAVFLSSVGGAVVLISNPQIGPGSRVGQELILEGTSDVDYLTLGNGNGLALAGPVDLMDYQTLNLIWDGEIWVEVGRN